MVDELSLELVSKVGANGFVQPKMINGNSVAILLK